MTYAYNTTIGISVSKGDWDGAEWTISGYPRLSSKLPGFESAYDFEEVIKEKVNNSGITFDSEYCMFCAYAKTKQRAVGFWAFPEALVSFCLAVISKGSSKIALTES